MEGWGRAKDWPAFRIQYSKWLEALGQYEERVGVDESVPKSRKVHLAYKQLPLGHVDHCRSLQKCTTLTEFGKEAEAAAQAWTADCRGSLPPPQPSVRQIQETATDVAWGTKR